MSLNAGALAATTAAPAADVVETKRHRNKQWRFELSIPRHWTIMPTGVANGPNELARFISTENGHHLVLVSRHLLRPSETPTKILEQNREAMFDLYDRMAKSFVFEDL